MGLKKLAVLFTSSVKMAAALCWSGQKDFAKCCFAGGVLCERILRENERSNMDMPL
jgi:hypothetical protein